MKKEALFLAILLLLPLVSADVLPHPNGRNVENIITNLNDFPDYTFLIVAEFGERVLTGVCQDPIQIITSSQIPAISCYRDDIERGSVYAVNKTLPIKFSSFSNSDDLLNYFNSLSPIEVIKNVHFNTAVPDSKGTFIEYTINESSFENANATVVNVVKDEESTFSSFIVAFILTVVIEFLVVILFLKKIKKLTIALNLLWINLLTWLVALLLMNLTSSVIFLEILIILAESLLFMKAFKLKYKKALLISLVANVASALIGSFILTFL